MKWRIWFAWLKGLVELNRYQQIKFKWFNLLFDLFPDRVPMKKMWCLKQRYHDLYSELSIFHNSSSFLTTGVVRSFWWGPRETFSDERDRNIRCYHSAMDSRIFRQGSLKSLVGVDCPLAFLQLRHWQHLFNIITSLARITPPSLLLLSSRLVSLCPYVQPLHITSLTHSLSLCISVSLPSSFTPIFL